MRLARLNELGEMASTLAHELNQPLSAIANYVQGCRRMLEKLDDEHASRMRGALEETAKQALRAGDIIRHLREFVTRGETEKRPEDVKMLVEEAGALALVGSRERGIKSVFDFTSADSIVIADRIQIQQVLINLMRNAMEAMRDSPERVLTVTHPRRSVPTACRLRSPIPVPAFPTRSRPSCFSPLSPARPAAWASGCRSPSASSSRMAANSR